jgi:hypothetical protein
MKASKFASRVNSFLVKSQEKRLFGRFGRNLEENVKNVSDDGAVKILLARGGGR